MRLMRADLRSEDAKDIISCLIKLVQVKTYKNSVHIHKASFRVIIFPVVKRGSALRIKASTFDPLYKRTGQKEFTS